MSKESYYDILGVSKDASEEEIKKAYRRQSLQYHPDKNKDPSAYGKFQKIGEAYETLSDKDKRNEYDGVGNPFFKMGGMPSGMQGAMHVNMDDIFQGLFSGMGGMPPGMSPDFSHQMPGGQSSPFGNIHVFQAGGGGVPFGINMSQRIQRLTPIVKTINVTMEQVMNGATIPVEIDRWIIQEGQKVFEKETIYVDIPQGIDDNEIIILRERGNASNELKGDIKLFAKIDNQSSFKRNGLDIILEKHISLKDALCGFKFELKHLNGKSYTINNNEGSIVTPSYFKSIPDMGLTRNGHTGNLVITFEIDFPDSLSGKQISSLKEVLG